MRSKMRKEKRYKVLYWALILLASLNIITVILFTIKSSEQRRAREESIVVGSEQTPLTGAYIREELNFNQEQLELYRVESREFRHYANTILSNLNHYKAQLSLELQSEEPDRQITSLYADSIGLAHANLKEVTTHFYLKIRESCTPEQRVKLEKLFEPLFSQTPVMRGYGRRGEHRGGSRRGRNRE